MCVEVTKLMFLILYKVRLTLLVFVQLILVYAVTYTFLCDWRYPIIHHLVDMTLLFYFSPRMNPSLRHCHLTISKALLQWNISSGIDHKVSVLYQ